MLKYSQIFQNPSYFFLSWPLPQAQVFLRDCLFLATGDINSHYNVSLWLSKAKLFLYSGVIRTTSNGFRVYSGEGCLRSKLLVLLSCVCAYIFQLLNFLNRIFFN